jgi:DNA-3-methyladenine glycosylase I
MGQPCFDAHRCDAMLFEMLIIDGAQAGLSWSCILHKRENYRAAFDNWNIAKIAAYDEHKISELLQNSGIVRNKLKVNSAVVNAQAVLKLAGTTAATRCLISFGIMLTDNLL